MYIHLEKKNPDLEKKNPDLEKKNERVYLFINLYKYLK
jgi:hypothetical protein